MAAESQPESPTVSRLSGYAIYDTPGNKPRITNIHEAAEQGDLRMIAKFAKVVRFDIDARDRYGRTALMWACDVGHLEGVEMLLRYGADITPVEVQTRRTAMHWASRYGDASIVQELIDNGADIHAPDKWGLSPLYLALQKADATDHALPKLLIGLGAKYGNTPQCKTGEEIRLTPAEEFAATGVVVRPLVTPSGLVLNDVCKSGAFNRKTPAECAATGELDSSALKGGN